MNRLAELQDNLEYTWHEEGIFAVGDRLSIHATHLLERAIPSYYEDFVDVMFVNGCDPSVPHPIRYRVDHQSEQLEFLGVKTKVVNAWELSLDMVREAHLFVIFRCPYTDLIGNFIKLAHKLNKTVLYDIDDLVFDTAYTDQIKYLETMSPAERAGYDDGVVRMGKTMSLCDGGITTTPQLATEFEKVIQPVYVNRNVASQEMVDLSDRAVYERDVLPSMDERQVELTEHHRWEVACQRARLRNGFHIGYFSGSITHNDDFMMIMPAVVRFMEDYPDVSLHVVGDLDLPDELEPFSSRIVRLPFSPWRRLPKMIAGVDVNLIPLEDTFFNRAKSENKWVEAALVKVPSIASDVGALHDSIEDGSGILCETVDDWYEALVRLHDDPELRASIGEHAYATCIDRHTTLKTGRGLAEFIRSQMTKNIGFYLPSLKTSGGVIVAEIHAAMLQQHGYDVTLFSQSRLPKGTTDVKIAGTVLPAVYPAPGFSAHFDKLVATMWSTLVPVLSHFNCKKRYYLVQNFEPDFYDKMDPARFASNATYGDFPRLTFCTISPWCRDWLEKDYGKKVRYAPNGLDLAAFRPIERDWSGKIRVLVEGPSASKHKNVEESFEIVRHLDPNRFEIWYMSYEGGPKPGWRVDNFVGAVPHDKVGDIYRSCHILLKTSLLESFSYPPLEMMATGGATVVLANPGNAAYLVDGENCLLFDKGEDEKAAHLIERIASDPKLREHLRTCGIATAEKLRWENVKDQVLALYE
jgi:glycosyltransferase involved in cell wall biosynthesis